MGYLSVIGSVNTDIMARSQTGIVMRDSNPGSVVTSIGGVGCNIARALKLLGADVRFLTVFGGDDFARSARNTLSAMGLELSSSLTFETEASSVYLCVHDADGDLAVGVSDMGITRHLDAAFIRDRLAVLNGSELVVADCNLEEETLTELADRLTVPLMLDTVSTKKAVRAKSLLGKLTAVKPNLIEAKALTGRDDLPGILEAFKAYPGLTPFISLGADGLATPDGQFPVCPGPVNNTNGCGDAMTAAVAYSLASGRSVPDTARFALAVSAAVADAGSPAALTETTIRQYV